MPTLYPVVRSALFRLPPERAHELTIGILGKLPGWVRRVLRKSSTVSDPRLVSRLWGIDFPNPVGLAAGFDKGGGSFNSLGALGFGFVEIGTLTAHAQPGNPRPRLFRLPQDAALLNRMGFNNPGAEAAANRLDGTPIETVLGINIGKSKVTPLAHAVEDYVRSLELLERFAHYLVINVSSPNTPGLRELQDAEPLRALLRAIRTRNRPELARPPAPILLKLAPDLMDEQVDQAVEIAIEEGVAGIVAVNSTTSRAGLGTPATAVERLGPGGISGAPLKPRALEMVARIYRMTDGRIPIVGVGGIFTADDVWKRIEAGASLVQLYTGFIYRGPGIVQEINRGLLTRMEAGGFESIAEVVGTGVAA
ncbi:MAG: quinone-dependent dihydroorotate dehydrogenase [Gemmatimonas sp.]|nr:quinone-dependent dihydroorotate dehydrogenase [Gemmatimonas sp.]